MTRSIEDRVDIKDSVGQNVAGGNSLPTNDDWKPSSINASYVSVPDDEVIKTSLFHVVTLDVLPGAGGLCNFYRIKGSQMGRSDKVSLWCVA